MKLSEDKEIDIQEPTGGLGAEGHPNPEIFKLFEVKDWQPPKLELVFSLDDKRRNNGVGWITPRSDSEAGQFNLQGYKKELDDNLIGHTWSEILKWDFKFHEASRMI